MRRHMIAGSTSARHLRLARSSLGTGPLGNQFQPVREATAAATVAAAWEAGIRAFDTAPHYGAGLAERRLGQSLSGRPRAEYVVSTKVGRLLRPRQPDIARQPAPFLEDGALDRVWDFSRDGVLRSLEESLTRLGLDRVDIVYLHDPDEHWQQVLDAGYPALHELRDQGVVASIGVGMIDAPMLARFVAATDLDRVLLAGRHTLLEPDGAVPALDLCASRDVRVVAGGVLNSGILAAPVPGARYDYEPAQPAVLDRARQLEQVCQRHGVPLLAAALQFPLGHPAVESILFGARSPAEVELNCAALATSLPAALWDELKETGLLPTGTPVPG
jgi:D-threo-aldose 1-dehydrogenase